jgi:hypothetical protein
MRYGAGAARSAGPLASRSNAGILIAFHDVG